MQSNKIHDKFLPPQAHWTGSQTFDDNVIVSKPEESK